MEKIVHAGTNLTLDCYAKPGTGNKAGGQVAIIAGGAAGQIRRIVVRKQTQQLEQQSGEDLQQHPHRSCVDSHVSRMTAVRAMTCHAMCVMRDRGSRQARGPSTANHQRATAHLSSISRLMSPRTLAPSFRSDTKRRHESYPLRFNFVLNQRDRPIASFKLTESFSFRRCHTPAAPSCIVCTTRTQVLSRRMARWCKRALRCTSALRRLHASSLILRFS